MTDDQLTEWERLADAATPGPWYPGDPHDPDRGPMTVWCDQPEHPESPHLSKYRAKVIHGCGCCNSPFGISGHEEADRAFIVAARTAVPALIAEVRRLRAMLPAGT